MQPQILLSLTVVEERAGAAVFLNMPQLSISVIEVTGTNDYCEFNTKSRSYGPATEASASATGSAASASAAKSSSPAHQLRSRV